MRADAPAEKSVEELVDEPGEEEAEPAADAVGNADDGAVDADGSRAGVPGGRVPALPAEVVPAPIVTIHRPGPRR